MACFEQEFSGILRLACIIVLVRGNAILMPARACSPAARQQVESPICAGSLFNARLRPKWPCYLKDSPRPPGLPPQKYLSDAAVLCRWFSAPTSWPSPKVNLSLYLVAYINSPGPSPSPDPVLRPGSNLESTLHITTLNANSQMNYK